MSIEYKGLSSNGLHQYFNTETKSTSLLSLAPSQEQIKDFNTLVSNNFTKNLLPSLASNESVGFTPGFFPEQVVPSNATYDPTLFKNYTGPVSPDFSVKVDKASNSLKGTGSTIQPPKKTAAKYDFTNLTYPEDLFDPSGKYGSAYMVFYINVQEDSKFARDNPNLIVPDADAQKGIGASITRNKVSAVQLSATVGAIGAIGGAGVGSILGINGRGSGLSGAITGGSVGLGVGSAFGTIKNGGGSTDQQNSPDFKFSDIYNKSITRQTKRLKTAIALYTPNEISFKYGMNWDTDNTAILSAGLDIGESIGDSAAALKNMVVNGIDKYFNTGKAAEYTKTGGRAANSISGLVLSAANKVGPEGLSALTGLISNPKKEQSFNSVDFRTHQYTFRFWIRNSNEARSVENIIKQFKYHMHPEFKDGNDYIFLYPSEFDIKFYINGKESDQFPKLTSCVLTDMSTNYTPSGALNLLADGKIPEISINLAFRELAILTKSEIESGY